MGITQFFETFYCKTNEQEYNAAGVNWHQNIEIYKRAESIFDLYFGVNKLKRSTNKVTKP